MSLLTQFYPGPGGGGGSSVGVGAGWPSVIVSGIGPAANVSATGYPLVTGGTFAGQGVYQGLSTSPYFIDNLTSGQYTGITFNNIRMSVGFTPPATLEKMSLNNAIFANANVVSTALTAIAGTGAFVSTGIIITSNPSLASISTGIAMVPSATAGAIQFLFTGANLDATSVNHVLTSLVDNGALTVAGFAGQKFVDMSGGTSAGLSALTTAGAAARTALIAAGWTVSLRP